MDKQSKNKDYLFKLRESQKNKNNPFKPTHSYVVMHDSKDPLILIYLYQWLYDQQTACMIV